MDNRIDNLTLVPKWISRLEQDRILQIRCSEGHFWEGRRTIRRNEDEDMPVDNDGNGFRDDKQDRRRGENSLYWKAITQLLANETEEVSQFHN
jgi:hypothetical protein